MELEVQDLTYNYKGKNILNHVSFHFESSQIIGILGLHKTLLLEILDLQKKYQGKIWINHQLVGFHNKTQFQKEVALISQKHIFFTTRVEEEMNFIMDYYHFSGKNLKKRKLDSLRMVGLDSKFLSRKISTLSNGEKILFKIACNLIMNPKIILLDETFLGLDGNSKKLLLKLFRKLQEKKDRLIIIASHDVDLLYEFTDQLLILEDGKVLRFGDTVTIFRDISFLKNHQLDVPSLISFTTLAKERHVKLGFHRDILDLIKDVYKHV